MDSSTIIAALYLVIIVNLVMSAIIFSRGPRGIQNVFFGLMVFGVTVWSIAMAGFYSSAFHDTMDWLALTHAAALFMGVALIYFSNAFPKPVLKGYLIYLVPAGLFAIAAYAVSTGAVVSQTVSLEYYLGPLYLAYQFVFALFVFVATGLLIRQYQERTDALAKQQIRYLLVGVVASTVPSVVVDLIFPSMKIFNYTWLGPIFSLLLVVFVFMAIMRLGLFNIRIILSELFSLLVLLVMIVNVFLPESFLAVAIKAVSLVIITIFLYLFMKNVYRTDELVRELEEINERQETLIHFIGHEVKGFLTKAEGTFSIMNDGDLGQMPDGMKSFVARALTETRRGVRSVSDILKASNLKKGAVDFVKEPFDFKALVAESVEFARPAAQEKGLQLAFEAAEADYRTSGDKNEIGDHVLRNLIDNAIVYTPSGSIVVSLKREAGKFVVAVRDTGVGITAEDQERLFTEGGHGRESQKVNVNSTGYGLYIAKRIVMAHGGTIRAESAGAGKGATFTVELPA